MAKRKQKSSQPRIQPIKALESLAAAWASREEEPEDDFMPSSTQVIEAGSSSSFVDYARSLGISSNAAQELIDRRGEPSQSGFIWTDYSTSSTQAEIAILERQLRVERARSVPGLAPDPRQQKKLNSLREQLRQKKESLGSTSLSPSTLAEIQVAQRSAIEKIAERYGFEPPDLTDRTKVTQLQRFTQNPTEAVRVTSIRQQQDRLAAGALEARTLLEATLFGEDGTPKTWDYGGGARISFELGSETDYKGGRAIELIPVVTAPKQDDRNQTETFRLSPSYVQSLDVGTDRHGNTRHQVFINGIPAVPSVLISQAEGGAKTISEYGYDVFGTREITDDKGNTRKKTGFAFKKADEITQDAYGTRRWNAAALINTVTSGGTFGRRYVDRMGKISGTLDTGLSDIAEAAGSMIRGDESVPIYDLTKYQPAQVYSPLVHLSRSQGLLDTDDKSPFAIAFKKRQDSRTNPLTERTIDPETQRPIEPSTYVSLATLGRGGLASRNPMGAIFRYMGAEEMPGKAFLPAITGDPAADMGQSEAGVSVIGAKKKSFLKALQLGRRPKDMLTRTHRPGEQLTLGERLAGLKPEEDQSFRSYLPVYTGQAFLSEARGNPETGYLVQAELVSSGSTIADGMAFVMPNLETVTRTTFEHRSVTDSEYEYLQSQVGRNTPSIFPETEKEIDIRGNFSRSTVLGVRRRKDGITEIEVERSGLPFAIDSAGFKAFAAGSRALPEGVDVQLAKAGDPTAYAANAVNALSVAHPDLFRSLALGYTDEEGSRQARKQFLLGASRMLYKDTPDLAMTEQEAEDYIERNPVEANPAAKVLASGSAVRMSAQTHGLMTKMFTDIHYAFTGRRMVQQRLSIENAATLVGPDVMQRAFSRATNSAMGRQDNADYEIDLKKIGRAQTRYEQSREYTARILGKEPHTMAPSFQHGAQYDPKTDTVLVTTLQQFTQLPLLINPETLSSGERVTLSPVDQAWLYARVGDNPGIARRIEQYGQDTPDNKMSWLKAATGQGGFRLNELIGFKSDERQTVLAAQGLGIAAGEISSDKAAKYRTHRMLQSIAAIIPDELIDSPIEVPVGKKISGVGAVIPGTESSVLIPSVRSLLTEIAGRDDEDLPSYITDIASAVSPYLRDFAQSILTQEQFSSIIDESKADIIRSNVSMVAARRSTRSEALGVKGPGAMFGVVSHSSIPAGVQVLTDQDYFSVLKKNLRQISGRDDISDEEAKAYFEKVKTQFKERFELVGSEAFSEGILPVNYSFRTPHIIAEQASFSTPLPARFAKELGIARDVVLKHGQAAISEVEMWRNAGDFDKDRLAMGPMFIDYDESTGSFKPASYIKPTPILESVEVATRSTNPGGQIIDALEIKDSPSDLSAEELARGIADKHTVMTPDKIGRSVQDTQKSKRLMGAQYNTSLGMFAWAGNLLQHVRAPNTRREVLSALSNYRNYSYQYPLDAKPIGPYEEAAGEIYRLIGKIVPEGPDGQPRQIPEPHLETRELMGAYIEDGSVSWKMSVEDVAQLITPVVRREDYEEDGERRYRMSPISAIDRKKMLSAAKARIKKVRKAFEANPSDPKSVHEIGTTLDEPGELSVTAMFSDIAGAYMVQEWMDPADPNISAFGEYAGLISGTGSLLGGSDADVSRIPYMLEAASQIMPGDMRRNFVRRRDAFKRNPKIPSKKVVSVSSLMQPVSISGFSVEKDEEAGDLREVVLSFPDQPQIATGQIVSTSEFGTGYVTSVEGGRVRVAPYAPRKAGEYFQSVEAQRKAEQIALALPPPAESATATLVSRIMFAGKPVSMESAEPPEGIGDLEELDYSGLSGGGAEPPDEPPITFGEPPDPDPGDDYDSRKPSKSQKRTVIPATPPPPPPVTQPASGGGSGQPPPPPPPPSVPSPPGSSRPTPPGFQPEPYPINPGEVADSPFQISLLASPSAIVARELDIKNTGFALGTPGGQMSQMFTGLIGFSPKGERAPGYGESLFTRLNEGSLTRGKPRRSLSGNQFKIRSPKYELTPDSDSPGGFSWGLRAKNKNDRAAMPLFGLDIESGAVQGVTTTSVRPDTVEHIHLQEGEEGFLDFYENRVANPNTARRAWQVALGQAVGGATSISQTIISPDILRSSLEEMVGDIELINANDPNYASLDTTQVRGLLRDSLATSIQYGSADIFMRPFQETTDGRGQPVPPQIPLSATFSRTGGQPMIFGEMLAEATHSAAVRTRQSLEASTDPRVQEAIAKADSQQRNILKYTRDIEHPAQVRAYINAIQRLQGKMAAIREEVSADLGSRATPQKIFEGVMARSDRFQEEVDKVLLRGDSDAATMAPGATPEEVLESLGFTRDMDYVEPPRGAFAPVPAPSAPPVQTIPTPPQTQPQPDPTVQSPPPAQPPPPPVPPGGGPPPPPSQTPSGDIEGLLKQLVHLGRVQTAALGIDADHRLSEDPSVVQTPMRPGSSLMVRGSVLTRQDLGSPGEALKQDALTQASYAISASSVYSGAVPTSLTEPLTYTTGGKTHKAGREVASDRGIDTISTASAWMSSVVERAQKNQEASLPVTQGIAPGELRAFEKTIKKSKAFLARYSAGLTTLNNLFGDTNLDRAGVTSVGEASTQGAIREHFMGLVELLGDTTSPDTITKAFEGKLPQESLSELVQGTQRFTRRDIARIKNLTNRKKYTEAASLAMSIFDKQTSGDGAGHSLFDLFLSMKADDDGHTVLDYIQRNSSSLQGLSAELSLSRATTADSLGSALKRSASLARTLYPVKGGLNEIIDIERKNPGLVSAIRGSAQNVVQPKQIGSKDIQAAEQDFGSLGIAVGSDPADVEAALRANLDVPFDTYMSSGDSTYRSQADKSLSAMSRLGETYRRAKLAGGEYSASFLTSFGDFFNDEFRQSYSAATGLDLETGQHLGMPSMGGVMATQKNISDPAARRMELQRRQGQILGEDKDLDALRQRYIAASGDERRAMVQGATQSDNPAIKQWAIQEQSFTSRIGSDLARRDSAISMAGGTADLMSDTSVVKFFESFNKAIQELEKTTESTSTSVADLSKSLEKFSDQGLGKIVKYGEQMASVVSSVDKAMADYERSTEDVALAASDKDKQSALKKQHRAELTLEAMRTQGLVDVDDSGAFVRSGSVERLDEMSRSATTARLELTRRGIEAEALVEPTFHEKYGAWAQSGPSGARARQAARAQSWYAEASPVGRFGHEVLGTGLGAWDRTLKGMYMYASIASVTSRPLMEAASMFNKAETGYALEAVRSGAMKAEDLQNVRAMQTAATGENLRMTYGRAYESMFGNVMNMFGGAVNQDSLAYATAAGAQSLSIGAMVGYATQKTGLGVAAGLATYGIAQLGRMQQAISDPSSMPGLYGADKFGRIMSAITDFGGTASYGIASGKAAIEMLFGTYDPEKDIRIEAEQASSLRNISSVRNLNDRIAASEWGIDEEKRKVTFGLEGMIAGSVETPGFSYGGSQSLRLGADAIDSLSRGLSAAGGPMKGLGLNAIRSALTSYSSVVGTHQMLAEDIHPGSGKFDNFLNRIAKVGYSATAGITMESLAEAIATEKGLEFSGVNTAMGKVFGRQALDQIISGDVPESQAIIDVSRRSAAWAKQMRSMGYDPSGIFDSNKYSSLARTASGAAGENLATIEDIERRAHMIEAQSRAGSTEFATDITRSILAPSREGFTPGMNEWDQKNFYQFVRDRNITDSRVASMGRMIETMGRSNVDRSTAEQVVRTLSSGKISDTQAAEGGALIQSSGILGNINLSQIDTARLTAQASNIAGLGINIGGLAQAAGARAGSNVRDPQVAAEMAKYAIEEIDKMVREGMTPEQINKAIEDKTVASSFKTMYRQVGIEIAPGQVDQLERVVSGMRQDQIQALGGAIQQDVSLVQAGITEFRDLSNVAALKATRGTAEDMLKSTQLMAGINYAANYQSRLMSYGTQSDGNTALLKQVAQMSPQARAQAETVLSGDPIALSRFGVATQDFSLYTTQTGSFGGTKGMFAGYDEKIQPELAAQFAKTDERFGGIGRRAQERAGIDLSPYNYVDLQRKQNELQFSQMEFGFEQRDLNLSRRRETTMGSGIKTEGFAMTGEGMNARMVIKDLARESGLADAVATWKDSGEKLMELIDGLSEWGIEDKQIRLKREQEDFSMAQQEKEKEFNWKRFEMEGRHWYERFYFNQAKTMTQFDWQQTDMGIGRQRQVQQTEWQYQDLYFQRNKQNIGFGWQMEDFDRSLRYARGIERSDLMRQRERAVVEYSMNMGQSSREEGRMDTKKQWDSEDFQREQQRFEQKKQWAVQEMEMEKRQFEERRALQLEEMLRNDERIAKAREWMQEERQMEDERIAFRRASFILEQKEAENIAQYTKQMEINFLAIGKAMEAISTRNKEAEASIQYMAKTGELLARIGPYMNVFNTQLQRTIDEVIRLRNAPRTSGGGGGVISRKDSGGFVYGHDATVAGHPGASFEKFMPNQSFAEGGYTGQGGKYTPAGVVHGGEYVVPQDGALVLKGGSDGQLENLLQKAVDLLKVIADNSGSKGTMNVNITAQKAKDALEAAMTEYESAFARFRGN